MKEKSRSYRLEVVTPARTVLSQEVLYSVVNSGAGPVGILPGHAPLLGTVDKGVLTYRDLEKNDHSMEVGSGFYMISREGVSVVASSAVPVA